jgi:hypothetical protein
MNKFIILSEITKEKLSVIEQQWGLDSTCLAAYDDQVYEFILNGKYKNSMAMNLLSYDKNANDAMKVLLKTLFMFFNMFNPIGKCVFIFGIFLLSIVAVPLFLLMDLVNGIFFYLPKTLRKYADKPYGGRSNMGFFIKVVGVLLKRVLPLQPQSPEPAIVKLLQQNYRILREIQALITAFHYFRTPPTTIIFEDKQLLFPLLLLRAGHVFQAIKVDEHMQVKNTFGLDLLNSSWISKVLLVQKRGIS